MPHLVILHITGEEPVLGEIEQLPEAVDVSVKVNHPRRIDGKDLPYLSESVTTVIWPLTRINFIEVLPSREDEEIIGFVRE